MAKAQTVKMMNSFFLIFTTAVIVPIIIPPSLYACAVCFGGTETSVTEGLKIGMLFLLLIVGIVIGGIFAFVWFMIRRANEIKKHQIEEVV